MAEETKNKKSKTTTKSKKTTKKVEPKKETKKTPTKKVEEKKTTKKVEPKKDAKKTTKKETLNNKTKTQTKSKIVTTKKAIKKVEPKKEVKKVVEEPKESFLEKTLIFDGRQNQNLAEVVEKLEEQNVVLEDKVIKRSKAKRIAIVLLSILIGLIIVATTVYTVYSEIERKNNELTLNSDIYKKVHRNYKTISDITGKTQEEKEEEKENDVVENAKDEIEKIEYSNVKEISLADFERKVFDKENMTILIASKSCYHCITFEPIVNEVYKEKKKNIYKIDIMELTDAENDLFRTYYAYKSAPTIFTIKDGVVTSDVTGTMTKENLKNWVEKNA